MRISETAKNPTGETSFPSFGLKFLRDGMHSANAVTLIGEKPQDGYNFFKHRYTTQIPEFTNECFR